MIYSQNGCSSAPELGWLTKEHSRFVLYFLNLPQAICSLQVYFINAGFKLQALLIQFVTSGIHQIMPNFPLEKLERKP